MRATSLALTGASSVTRTARPPRPLRARVIVYRVSGRAVGRRGSGLLCGMHLTKTFSPDTYTRALESWSWLHLDGKVPVLASLFGDIFLQDPTGYWFLDSVEGQLTLIAATRDELQAILGTEAGQDLSARRSGNGCRAAWPPSSGWRGL
jgi:hypothetical protein